MKRTASIIDPVADMRWDTFVESHLYGKISHVSAWKLALEKSFPHMKACYLAIDHGGDIQAALPFYCVESLLKGKRLISIPFATLADPLVSCKKELEVLLEAAIAIARQQNIPHVEVTTSHTTSMFEGLPFAGCTRYVSHYLFLDSPPHHLMRSFHRSCVKQKIHRAYKCGFQPRKAESRSDLRSFYMLYVVTRKRLGLPPHPFSLFEAFWDVLSPQGRVEVLLAGHGNKPVAGLMLFKFKDRVSAEFLAYDRDYVEDGPHHLLFWEAINQAYNENYMIFDFGRTALTNEGLVKFKERWGTRPMALPQFFYPRQDYKDNSFLKNPHVSRIIRATCQKVPDSLFRHIGEFCYRNLW